MEHEVPKNGLKMPRWFYWGLALIGAYIIYRSSEVLLPFIISFVLAYIFDPFVDYYEMRGMRRGFATAIVFVIVFCILVVFIALVIPPVIRQARQAEEGISRYLKKVHRQGVLQQDRNLRRNGLLPDESPSPDTTPAPGPTSTVIASASTEPSPVAPTPSASSSPAVITMPSSSPGQPPGDVTADAGKSYIHEVGLYWLVLTEKYPILKKYVGDQEKIESMLATREKEIAGYSVKLLSGVSGWALSSLSNLILIVLVPILTFYFLCVIDHMKERILFLISDPEKKREVLVISHQINVMLGRYLKGQFTIAFLFGLAITVCAYALSFFFHTKYSLLLGFFAGLFSIIPYFGAIMSTLTALLIGLFTATVNPWLAAILFPVMLVLMNQIFDNFISPKIIGEQVGLHPLWTIFALLAGSKLFGVIGMLISVPIAATIKICLIRIFPRLIEPVPAEEKIYSTCRVAKGKQDREPQEITQGAAGEAPEKTAMNIEMIVVQAPEKVDIPINQVTAEDSRTQKNVENRGAEGSDPGGQKPENNNNPAT